MITKEKFKSETSKFFSTGRSKALKVVDDSIEFYHRNPNPHSERALASAIVQWAVQKGVKANGDINTGRNARVVRQLVADVSALRGGEACRNLCTAVVAEAPVVEASSGNAAYKWVNAVSRELEQFNTYACMDAGNFPQCVKLGKEKEIQDRRKGAKGRPPMPNVIQQGQYEWKQTSLKMRFNDTQRFGKQGECTSFGYLAAHVLTTGRNNGPRVELVAHDAGRGSHVYVLVGRTGGDTNGRIPENWDAVIVDAWAASLGHPCVYKNRKDFLFRGMTKNLELVMVRPES